MILKEVIKKEKENVLRAIDADTLVVWKVSEIFSVRVDVI